MLHDLVPAVQNTVFSAAAVGVFATVVGIFVAFRSNEAYDRWWEARTLWGSMVNASRNFGRQVTTLLEPRRLVAPEPAAEMTRTIRRLVYRHMAYVNALRLQLRDQAVFPEINEFIGDREAAEPRSARNVATQLNQRQSSELASLLKDDAGSTLILTQIDSTLEELLNLQGGMERINNTAFPDRVVFTTRLLVLAVALFASVAFIEPEPGVALVEMLAVLVIVISFLSVRELGEELNDPFCNEPNDTPMTALCRTIEIDLRQQLGEAELPDPIEPVDGVLM